MENSGGGGAQQVLFTGETKAKKRKKKNEVRRKVALQREGPAVSPVLKVQKVLRINSRAEKKLLLTRWFFLANKKKELLLFFVLPVMRFNEEEQRPAALVGFLLGLENIERGLLASVQPLTKTGPFYDVGVASCLRLLLR